MTAAEFRATVAALEPTAAADPKGYRTRVALLAALGYGYILAMLTLVCGVVLLLLAALVTGHANPFVVKLLLIVGAVAILILKALWVRIPPPQGMTLFRSDAPALYRLIEDAGGRLQAPRIHSILLTQDLNAAIVQIPRYGLLGPQRNYLMLGMPLLQALTPDEFRAVLAHELGHLSGNHGGFAAWIYRIRQTWTRLLAQLEAQRGWLGNLIFTRFVRWYAPYFNAYSFVLARADEYEADRCAAEIAGREASGRALARLEVLGRFTGAQYWPGVYQAAAGSPRPSGTPVSAFGAAARSVMGTPAAQSWLHEAWARPTDYDDTHPALQDRLRALGWTVTPGFTERPADRGGGEAESAADAFLGSSGVALAAALDDAWRQEVSEAWARRHAELAGSRRRLAELAESAASRVLAVDEEWERIRLTEEIEGEQASRPLAERAAAAYPTHGPINYFFGQTLLAEGDERGIGYIESAMREDGAAVGPGCQAIFAFLWARGRKEDAERYRSRFERRDEELARASAERSNLSGELELEPHGLGTDAIAALVGQLATIDDLQEVYLVRRRVSITPEIPCYVAGFVSRARWYRYRGGDAEATLLRAIDAITWPTETFLVVLTHDTSGIEKQLRKVEGGRIV